MAVLTEPKPETAIVEPNAQRIILRLHEEILPPKLDPSTPTGLRNARRALAILAVIAIVIQFLSTALGHWLNPVARSGTDAYTIWQGYMSGPVPDVLVIGNSLAQADIDEAGLSADLSKAAGRSVTVKKMGFNGQGPLFYDALMYRIMKLPKHPKLIVVSTAAPDLNAGCVSCMALLTPNLWDISDLTDVGFMQLALSLDPDPGRLLAGWGLPALAYYPSIVALQCLAVDFARSSSMSILGRVPQQLQNPDICETQPGYLLAAGWARQPAMTQNEIQASTDNYRRFMADYEISTNAVSSLGDLISRAHAGGTTVVLVQAPLHSGVRGLFPGAQQAYQQQVQSVASNLHIDLVNLVDSVPDDPALWVDTLHLDRAGAAYFAPRLASMLAPILGS